MTTEAQQLSQLKEEVAGLRSTLESQRQEIDKLAKVITEVVGHEFDAIQERQQTDQRATLRWMTASVSLTVSMLRELADKDLIDEEAVIDAVRTMRDKLMGNAEAMGAHIDLESLLGDE